MEYMATQPDNAFDIVITSPPYNLGGFSKQGKWAGAALANGYNSHNDDMPYHEYIKWQRRVISELYRLISDKGAIYYNHKWRIQDGILDDRSAILKGFPVRQIIIWKRAGGMNFNDGYYVPTYEVIYMIAKPAFKLSKYGNRFGDVWEITQDSDNDHPAPFPVNLPKRILQTVDKGRVFDPFLGSGSSAIAAHYFGCEFVGCEIDKDYFDAAQDRFFHETSQIAMVM